MELERLRELLQKHVEKTDSEFAHSLLKDWPAEALRFSKVAAKQILSERDVMHAAQREELVRPAVEMEADSPLGQAAG